MISKLIGRDVVPKEALATVICTVAAAATSAAAICARRSAGVTTVVARGEPFQRTTASAGNPIPITSSVKPGLPASADPGFSNEMEKVAGMDFVPLKMPESVAPGGALQPDAGPSTERWIVSPENEPEPARICQYTRQEPTRMAQ